jgi:hypothetical protein
MDEAAAEADRARPGLLTREQEVKFLARWVLDALAGLRRDYGQDWIIGMLARGTGAVAWWTDGTAKALAAGDPVLLRPKLAAACGEAGR